MRNELMGKFSPFFLCKTFQFRVSNFKNPVLYFKGSGKDYLSFITQYILRSGDCVKLIDVLSIVSLITLLTANCLVVVRPVFATSSAENTWAINAPMPGAVEGGRAAAVDGKIYVIGGSVNYQYDPATDTWAARNPMPTARLAFGMAVCQNKIFTFGGYSLNNGNPTYYAVNEAYDPSTDTWQVKQPMPTARIPWSASAVGNLIYLIGGIADEPHHEVLMLNDVYNVANDSWTTKEPMPKSGSPASSVCAGKIFILGDSSTQIYDPFNNSWSMGASMPTKEVSAVAAATTGEMALRRIYVVGGYGTDTSYLDDIVQVYDPENNTWTYGMPMPTARGALSTAVLDDKIYAIGGALHRNNEMYIPFGYGTPDPVYVYENTPPKLSLLSPLSTTYNVTNVTLVFTVDKAVSWAAYSLDGEPNITMANNMTLTDLSSGLHNVTVSANDTYGNMVTSKTVAFTVAEPDVAEPFPAIAFAVVITTSAGLICAGLIIFFKKHKHVEHPKS
jgi:N-acetylneuraminic acid mutarotase